MIISPLENEKYLHHLKLLGVLFTVMMNCILVYVLIFNPYALYFDRLFFSETSEATLHILAISATLLNLILIIGLMVIMMIKYWKKKKFFVLAPIP
jgi:hypothetical protein